jgi:signal transduction histidine kinase
LTSIKGHAQLLLRNLETPNSTPEQLRLGLTTIDIQTAQMTRMLDHLLDAARIQAGAYQPRLAPCAFKDCLETVLRELNPDEPMRIDVDVKTALATGNWEQEMIEQLLANLLGNALKYSPEGQRVGVEVEQRGDDIAVAVSDKGMGIAAGELPGLFERFHRTPQAEGSGLPGTGLGLFICRGIVEAHGGRIWVESPGEGQGSTFRFTLPIGSPKDGQAGEHKDRSADWRKTTA